MPEGDLTLEGNGSSTTATTTGHRFAVGLVHIGTGGGDSVSWLGLALHDLGQGIPERSPVVAKLGRLRAGKASCTSLGEGRNQRVRRLHIGARGRSTSHISVDGLVLGTQHLKGEVDGELLLRISGVRVDIPAIDTGERGRRTTRTGRNRHYPEVVTEILAVIAKDPRPVDDHVGLTLAEERISLATIGLEGCPSRLQVDQVLHRLDEATLIGDTGSISGEELTTERAPEGEVVVAILVDDQLLATLDQIHQGISRCRRGWDRALVVVERDRLHDTRGSVDLPINRDPIDREGGEAIQLIRGQVGDIGNKASAHLVAQIVVGSSEDIGATTSGNLSLPLVEDLIEGNLEHVDGQTGVLGLNTSHDLGDCSLF